MTKKLLTALFTIALAATCVADSKYCNTDETQTKLRYAPDWLEVSYLVTNIEWHIDETVQPPREWCETNITTATKVVMAPTAEQYHDAGWLDNATTRPEPPAGMTVDTVKYVKDGLRLLSEYTYKPLPVVPVVHKYSKLKIYAVLSRMNLWDTLVSWMQSETTPEGVNVKVAFDMAQELNDQHPLFEAYLKKAQTALGIDDATRDLILSQCELDEMMMQ